MLGRGYPSYIQRIEDAAGDLAELSDPAVRLVIWVDSEDLSVLQKRAELTAVVQETATSNPHTLIIANCCVETWLLGNRPLCRKSRDKRELAAFVTHYDVVDRDPEGCLQRPEDRNRAETHLRYLKAVLRNCIEVGHPDDGRRLSYSKRNPGPCTDASYLRELKTRVDAGELASMGALFTLDA